MIAGLCSVTLRAEPVDEVLRVATRAGLAAIEWGGDVHVPPGDPAASAIGRRSADAGIACASYGSYLFAGRLDREEAARTLDTAVALGAPNVRVWTDWVGPDPLPAVRRRVVDDLRVVATDAAQRDLVVSLEFHPGTVTETAASTLTLLDEVGAPNLHTYWQAPVGPPVADLLESWAAVRTRTSHLHVFRWRSHEDRQPLAEGVDLWPAVLASVPREPVAPVEPVAFLEFVRGDAPAQVLADAAVLRAWLS